jgi:hypothetical protein
MSKVRLCKAFVMCFLLWVSMLGAQQASLSGRVSDAGNGQGISALTIRLEPPKAEGDRQIVTFTDTNGYFKLPNLSSGRYLLTVSQGPTLLHREVVEVNGETTKEIRLQRG